LSGHRIIGQIVGAACFVDHNRYMAPDGMVLLTADEVGVHVNFRSAWFQKLALANARFMMSGYESDDFWYSDWSAITTARRDRDGDAIFLMNRSGGRVRFIGTDPRQMQALTQELLRRDVSVEWVKSTFWDVYRSPRHWRARTMERS
jgi:hypothetical protein